MFCDEIVVVRLVDSKKDEACELLTGFLSDFAFKPKSS
jgi:hypothetical protein